MIWLTSCSDGHADAASMSRAVNLCIARAANGSVILCILLSWLACSMPCEGFSGKVGVSREGLHVGNGVQVVAGPGMFGKLLDGAVSEGSWEFLIVDATLAVGVMIRDLHVMLEYSEGLRAQKLMAILKECQESTGDEIIRGMLTTARFLLDGHDVEAADGCDVDAVRYRQKGALTVAGGKEVVDWGWDHPPPLWAGKHDIGVDGARVSMESLWWATRYLAACMNQLSDENRNSLLLCMQEAAQDPRDLGCWLRFGRNDVRAPIDIARTVEEWAVPSLLAQFPCVVAITDAVQSGAVHSGSGDLDASLLRLCKLIATVGARSGGDWSWSSQIAMGRRLAAASYLFVGICQASPTRATLLRFGGWRSSPKLLVEGDLAMWAGLMESAEELQRALKSRGGLELEGEKLASVQLAGLCMDYLRTDPADGEAKKNIQEGIYNVIWQNAQWGEESGVAINCGSGWGLCKTGCAYLVSVPVQVRGRESRALAAKLNVDDRLWDHGVRIAARGTGRQMGVIRWDGADRPVYFSDEAIHVTAVPFDLHGDSGWGVRMSLAEGSRSVVERYVSEHAEVWVVAGGRPLARLVGIAPASFGMEGLGVMTQGQAVALSVWLNGQ